MLQVLYKLLTRQPEALAEHVGAYAQLAAAQTRDAAEQWKSRAISAAVFAVGAALTLGFAGMALMLWAVTPAEAIAHPWVLWLVPLLPLGLMVGGWIGLRRPSTMAPYALLREQWQQDAQALREGLSS